MLPGSLARSCNVATDRLVYQDVCGLSATEPCRGLGFGAALSPRMLGCCKAGPVGSWALSSGWQAQLTLITQTSARANVAVPGSIPGKSGI